MGVIKHGFALANKRDPFYVLYRGIKKRCNSKNNISYKNYGGRGIKCLWDNFEEFKNDMYDSYLEHIKEYGRSNTSIDRIDNNGNYCKENCRWASRKEQTCNRRNTIFTIIDGVKYSSRDIADLCGICIDGAGDRIRNYNKGRLSKEGLFYKGKLERHNRYNCKVFVEVDGKTYSLYDLVDMCGITHSVASHRITDYKKGKKTKEALFKIGIDHRRLIKSTLSTNMK